MIGVGLSITSLAVRRRPGNPIARLKAPLLRDPSDLSTLFQDAAGTIPVTSPGDTVMRQNNKGTLGGHFLATGTLTYQTDGSRHWLETGESGGALEFSESVPFSTEVFEGLAFRLLSFSHAFPSIVCNRGVYTNNTSQRQPLIFATQSSPSRMSASFGGKSVSVNLPAALPNTDVVLTASGSAGAASKCEWSDGLGCRHRVGRRKFIWLPPFWPKLGTCSRLWRAASESDSE